VNFRKVPDIGTIGVRWATILDVPVIVRLRMKAGSRSRVRELITAISVPHLITQNGRATLGFAPWASRHPIHRSAVVVGLRTVVFYLRWPGERKDKLPFPLRTRGGSLRLIGLCSVPDESFPYQAMSFRSRIDDLQAHSKTSMHLHVSKDQAHTVRAYQTLGFTISPTTPENANELEMIRPHNSRTVV
jgi:hypothetical protein